MPVNNLIEVRRGVAATWTSVNPTLSSGEPGFETDTGNLKVGDGSTAWTSLPYLYSVTNTVILGDIFYASAAQAITRLAGNTTVTKKYLAQTGTGSVSAAPAWGTIAYADVSGGPAVYQSGEFTGATNGQQFLSYTTPNDSTNHTYQIGCWLNITSAVALSTIRMNVSYTLPSGAGVNQDFYGQGPTGSLVTLIPSTSTGPVYFLSMTIRAKPNTLIQIQFVTASAAVVDGGAWAQPVN